MIRKNKLVQFTVLQLLNIWFSLSGVAVKFASLAFGESGIFSFKLYLFIGIYILMLGIYAFFWQKVLKWASLTSAYLNKSFCVFWSLLWAMLIFNESITFFNIVGTSIILVGTILVMDNE